MEDGQGDVGQDSSGGASETPLSGDLPSETIVENTSVENQVEDSYEEGEIMVEIVGSDVFVGGVGGEKEGDFGSGEVGDLEGQAWENREQSQTQDFPEAMDVSGEGDGNQIGENESGLSESRDEKKHAVTEEVDNSLSEPVDVDGGASVSVLSSRGVGGVDEEVWNPGIEAVAVSSSSVMVPVVISEEKTIENQAADNDSADFVTREPFNHPVEAVLDGKTGFTEEKEVLCSSDNAPDHDADSLPSHEETKEAHGGQTAPSELSLNPNCEGPENVKVDESGSVVGEVGLVNASASVGGEISGIVMPGEGSFRDNAERASTDGDCIIEAKLLDEKEVLAAERKDSVLKTDALVSDVQDEKNHGIVEKSVVSERGEAIGEELDAVLDSKEEASNINLPDISSGNDGCLKIDGSLETNTVNEKSVVSEGGEAIGEELHVVLDSKEEASNINLPDISSGNDGCLKTDGGLETDLDHEKSVVSERGEAIGEEFHDVLDSKDGGSNITLLDISSGNDGCLKTDRGLETNIVQQNHVFSDEPLHLADASDTVTGKNEKGLNDDIQVDTEEKKPNTLSPTDEEIVQADSGMYSNEPLIDTTVGEVTDDQKIEISQMEVVEGGGSSEKGEGIDFEIPKQSLECQDNAEVPVLDASTENMQLPEKSACSNVETDDVRVTDDHVVCNDPIVNAEAVFDNVVHECVSSQSKEEEVPVQIAETSNHGVDKLESINLIPNEVADIAAISDSTQVSILLETTEKAELHVRASNISLPDGGDVEENSVCDMATSSEEVIKSSEADVNSGKSNGVYIAEGHDFETKLMDVEEERESDRSYHGGKEIDSELGTEEPASETEKLEFSNEQTMKSTISLRMNLSGYLLPPEDEGVFAISDLVWGKVRSHPWWPGQIFDPADASEKAVKYYKKDSYLVAYFGDRTFAWNDSSLLKPFRSHFSQIEKQSNSEAFQNAVNCALEEVSRRVELGLACSCIPKDAYAKIETQVVENTGIREESSRRKGVDQSSGSCCFEPDKLLDYARDLAPRASSGADRLDIVIAQAQLSAFYRFKGYRSPTEFPPSGELLENDANADQISDEIVGSDTHKHSTELIVGREYSPDAEDESVAASAKKRKALDPLIDGSEKRVSINDAKVSMSVSQTPKPSFKIGECIRRVASQLTGSTSLVKGNGDETVIGGSPNIYEHSERRDMVVSAESSSVDEMLSQLQLIARDPKKGHDLLNIIHVFFMGFRSSIALNKRGRKKRTEQTGGASAEEFEFDDVNDSYWTDRIVQNYTAEQLLNSRKNGAGAGNLQLVQFVENSAKSGRKTHSRKRFSTGNYPTEATEIDENVKRRKQESSPAELILNFAERKYVPSEINLNKMFRRFGPLMESETEVDHESGSAKVIFKRGSDAEVARNSSEKFNIFGPVLVNYQIGYTPLISVKISPVALPHYQEDPVLML